MNDEVIERIADAVMILQRKESDGNALASLEAQYADVERSIKNLLRLVEQRNLTSTTNQRLTELESSKEDLVTRITAEQLYKIDINKPQIIYMLTQYREVDLDTLDGQCWIIDTFVHSVYLYDDKIIITGNYTNEDGSRKEITVEELDINNAVKMPNNGAYISSNRLPPPPY